jgi:multiple sugar transport system permease protein
VPVGEMSRTPSVPAPALITRRGRTPWFRRRPGRSRGSLLGVLGVLAFLAVVCAPLYWMLVTALRPDSELFSVPPQLTPTKLDLSVVARTLSNTPLLAWLSNSVLVSVVATIAATALGVPAGYALSRFSSRSTDAFSAGVLVTQMLPPLLLLVPIFVIFRETGLTDSFTGLIIADTATILPLSIWMSKAMIDAVPRELDEAAMVDGCTVWQVLVRVVLPICLPGLAATAIYGFIETWDEFLFAKTLITSAEKWTASVGLYSFQGQEVVPINQVMLAAVLFTLPPLVLFLAARRGLVSGLAAGAVKG